MMPGTPEATEAELIARVRAGEVNAFEPLITQHRQQVLAIVARHVPAVDVAATAQDVFVRAFLSLKSYRAERPFGHWLARIAVRACCDFWRQQKRQPDCLRMEGLIACGPDRRGGGQQPRHFRLGKQIRCLMRQLLREGFQVRNEHP